MIGLRRSDSDAVVCRRNIIEAAGLDSRYREAARF
jgi:hypothetical protein